METVTGPQEKLDVTEFAKEIIEICDKHTNSIGMARAAIQIADTIMASRQFAEESALSGQAQ